MQTLKDQTYTKIELSTYEKALTNLNRCGEINVIGISILENDTLDSETVKQALVYLQKRHPLLRAFQEINKKTGDMFLMIPKDFEANSRKYAEMIDFEWIDDCTHSTSRDDMIRHMEMVNDKLFTYSSENLLWRFKGICFTEDGKTKYALGIVIPLQIVDGINMCSLVIEIVNMINAIKSGQTCKEMIEKLDVVDNLHTLCERDGIYGQIQAKKVSQLAAKEPCDFMLNEKLRSNKESIGTKINLLKISRDLTTKILKCSKLKQVRLTGYFNAVAFYALRALYIENGIEMPKDCSCEIPANFRFRLKNPIDFSNVRFLCGLGTAEVGQPEFGSFTDFWKDAKLLDERIQECISVETGSIFSFSHNFSNLNEYNKITNEAAGNINEMCQKFHKNNKCDLLISNLGRIVWEAKKLSPDGPLLMNEIYFGDSVKSNPNVLPALMFHMIYWNGEIMIELSGNKSSIDATHLNRFMELYEKFINESVL